MHDVESSPVIAVTTVMHNADSCMALKYPNELNFVIGCIIQIADHSPVGSAVDCGAVSHRCIDWMDANTNFYRRTRRRNDIRYRTAQHHTAGERIS